MPGATCDATPTLLQSASDLCVVAAMTSIGIPITAGLYGPASSERGNDRVELSV